MVNPGERPMIVIVPRTARVLFALPLLAAALCLPRAAHSASSVLIWPIDPVLESDQRASALWLENRGTDPVMLQMRIFSWRQDGKDEQYDEQREVIGSPPMIRIAPGAKQLLRLTRLQASPAGSERAYRIVIDEIPTPDTTGQDAEGKAIRFQMRYSVPLFLYGDGLWFKPDPDKQRKTPAGQPQLEWRREIDAGKPYLVIDNRGPVHARLTKVSFAAAGGQPVTVSTGLLGYVLAQSSYRWPLPAGVGADATLHAVVNGNTTEQAIQPAP